MVRLLPTLYSLISNLRPPRYQGESGRAQPTSADVTRVPLTRGQPYTRIPSQASPRARTHANLRVQPYRQRQRTAGPCASTLHPCTEAKAKRPSSAATSVRPSNRTSGAGTGSGRVQARLLPAWPQVAMETRELCSLVRVMCIQAHGQDDLGRNLEPGMSEAVNSGPPRWRAGGILGSPCSTLQVCACVPRSPGSGSIRLHV